MKENLDKQVVESFGDEWKKFNHHHFDSSSLKDSFNQYFDIFPFDSLKCESEGFDMGCGSGRWSKFIAPNVGKLNLIDPSQDALSSAMQHLSDHLIVIIFALAFLKQISLRALKTSAIVWCIASYT